MSISEVDCLYSISKFTLHMHNDLFLHRRRILDFVMNVQN